MIEMVLTQFAFKTMLGCRLPLPGWRARGRVSLCQPFYCAYRLYAHMQRHCALDGPTDAEQLQTSHDGAGVAVAFCAVEDTEACGLDSEASRLPRCPHAAAG
jgi:hypothetical protein